MMIVSARETGKDLRPMPEMVQRGDIDNLGEWDIHVCAAERGAPMTAVLPKQMHVPLHDEELDRTIRAHEMMHAKVSPTDRTPWVERGISSDHGLQAAEEARVNFLIREAGFDPKLLTDGGEKAAGERCAARGDWAAAVYFIGAAVFTGSLNPFLTGIRRHKPQWGSILRDISKKIEKELKKQYKKDRRFFGSTQLDRHDENLIEGFFVSESMGEWLDRLANPPEEEKDDDDDDEQGNGERADGQQQGQQGDGEEQPPDDREQQLDKEGKPPIGKQDLENHDPLDAREGGSWARLVPKTMPLTRHVPGGMGRRRIASNIGRNPRRIQRLITDPQKRIFDRRGKGNGGVVLIDGSGSMSLDHANILSILEAAPGATVAVYSCKRDDGTPNLFILADKGRMTHELPDGKTGNGVDGPALKWAIQQRQKATAPVMWVTDGGVHGPQQGYNDRLGMDCIKTVIESKVLLRGDVDSAVEALKELQVGKKPRQWWPRYFRTTYLRRTGKSLDKIMR